MKMTWNGLAQSIFKGISDDEAGAILWNCTAFPMNTIEGTTEQLKEMHKKSGGDVDLALAIADTELREAMATISGGG